MNKSDSQNTFITPEGKQKITDELNELKNIKRKQISERIKEAKELGDLSENAEYTEAKNDQAFTEGRILEIESVLRRATIIRKKTSGIKSKVDVGSKVKIKDEGKTLEYDIVGSNESDPVNGKISNESPIGQAFLGKKVGDIIEIDVPNGTKQYEIVAIS
ncbi:MAG: transcription elongation factor GreA [bacterium]|nr:transcription elongation factor GreA [bacterium]